MSQRSLTLELLPEAFAVARLDGESSVPEWAQAGAIVSVTRTATELSVVCADAAVPPGVQARRGLRCLRVRGPLDFAEVGVLDALAGPLARAGISIFTLSTYDTDYVFLGEAEVEAGLAALAAAGHAVRRLGAG